VNPSEAWEFYVGWQPPSEFMAFADTKDVFKAVRDYVASADTCDELSDEERANVGRLLVSYIENEVQS
jgi:nucleoid-associated protein YejK